jgi:hypothetical protein
LLFLNVVEQALPAIVVLIACHRSSTGSGPALGGIGTVADDAQVPDVESKVNGYPVPATQAVICAFAGASDPISTVASTPTVHVESADEKYGSAHVPLKSVTFRAIGVLGGLPLPADDQPRANRIPFGD